ncbi:MAG: hypothetical protein RLO18_32450, partial [Gimesia chilikensis]
MAAPAWSLETLIHTLFTGEKLPGETSDAPPWPLAWDDEYRRSTVISHIDQYYGELPQAIDPQQFHTTHAGLRHIPRFSKSSQGIN